MSKVHRNNCRKYFMSFAATRNKLKFLLLVLGLFCSSCIYITYQNGWVYYSSRGNSIFTFSVPVTSKHHVKDEESWLNFSTWENLNESNLSGIKPLKILFCFTGGRNVSFKHMEEAKEAAKTCWGPFKTLKAPACVFTEDLTVMESADALVYHGPFKDRDEPVTTLNKNKYVSNQIRIFYARESPYRKTKNPSEIPNVAQTLNIPNDVNWTFTYRSDSDIPANYGSFQPLPSKNSKENSDFKSSRQMEQFSASTKSKSKLIAWIVSHCNSLNKREVVAQKLQKFLPVDIYGRCGPFNCASERENSSWSNCYQELGSQYKFFLAFENNMCEDYVTEKMYLPMQNNMVPIVFGGADYRKMAPPHSYINVLDFPSIKELADHIKFLDENEEEYNKYFLWREKYQVEYYKAGAFCSLCEKLWRHSVVQITSGNRQIDPSYKKRYDNLLNFWLYSKNSYKVRGDKKVNSKKSMDKLSSKQHTCWLPPKRLFE